MDENSLEVTTAIRATRMASALCRKVREGLAAGGSIVKSDRSPVTIADYGSQAIICKVLKETFPSDAIAAEEDLAELRKPNRSEILSRVSDYVNHFVEGASLEAVCSWIDCRSHFTPDRFWTLDPIDGTKGFLRGDQYAIALALIENGSVKLGVMACPNLHVDAIQPRGEKGCLFLAMKGSGAFQIDAEGGAKRLLSVSKVMDPSQAIVTESVEPDHADHLAHERIARALSILRPSIRMDSQAKYGMVARGEATLYLRVPSPSDPGYREKIWDHAAGSIITEEAGGRVTDISGQPLDFSCGIRLEKNRGILVTNGLLHDAVLRALQGVTCTK